MKVYIASKYLAHESINQFIYERLMDAGIDAFLPKSINVDAITNEEMLLVGEKCYAEIDKCDVILVVAPFGNSVSCEIGYAICQRRKMGQRKRLVLFSNANCDLEKAKKEAMITPYFDATVNSVQQLISYLHDTSE